MLIETKMEYSNALTSSRATPRPQPFGPCVVCLYEDNTYSQRSYAEACLTLHFLGQSDCSSAFKET